MNHYHEETIKKLDIILNIIASHWIIEFIELKQTKIRGDIY